MFVDVVDDSCGYGCLITKCNLFTHTHIHTHKIQYTPYSHKYILIHAKCIFTYSYIYTKCSLFTQNAIRIHRPPRHRLPPSETSPRHT